MLIPAYVPLVSSSSGYIRVNGTSPSTPGQQVQAGGSVNLYFGEVTWTSSQMYLLMSNDNMPQVSVGDVIYTPIFLLSDLTNPTIVKNYTSGQGSWIVGNNWINGTVAKNAPVGNYTIKAFDPPSSTVAVTDTFIIVYTVIYSANLQAYPPSGPGGITAQFTGSGFPPSSPVTISYYDSGFGSWNFLTGATADALGRITFPTQIPDLRQSLGAGDYPEGYTQVSYRAEINGVVYCYANYDEYSRGLKTVGNQTANGLYGNGTNLASTVSVQAGDSLTISGKWFHPNDAIYARWDGKAVVGTVTGDQWLNAAIIGTSIANATGYFVATATIPTADAGQHFLSIEDSQTKVIITITVGQTYFPPPPTNKIPSIIILSCQSDTTYLGFKVTINGKLLFFNQTAISEAPILLSSNIDGGSSWQNLTLVYTDSSGAFSAQWMPTALGNYLIKAEYEGSLYINRANQTVTLALAPYSNQNVFSVTSNSTVSSLSFDSIKNQLSFTVTGPSGTTGFVDVGIAKSLILDLTNLQVYIDGIGTQYTATSTSDSWFLHLSYTHSTHNITINLQQSPNPTPTPTTPTIPEFPSTAILPVLAGLMALSIILAKKKLARRIHR
jgi:hypothetical protein